MLEILPTSLLIVSTFVVRQRKFPLNRTFTTLTCAVFDYSWHEMGVYDLPAIIDYILEVSKQHSLYYVAHSMGCTILCTFSHSTTLQLQVPYYVRFWTYSFQFTHKEQDIQNIRIQQSRGKYHNYSRFSINYK